MMSRSRPAIRRPATVFIAAALIGATALSACSTPEKSGSSGEAKDVPGITKTSVKIGTHTPLTGPASAGYAPISKAAAAYFAYLNAKGGVNGRKIDYVVKDDGYNPATTSTVVRELVQQDKVFAIVNGLGTPTHAAVVDYLNQQKVPDLFVASGASLWNQPEKSPQTFGFNLDYVREGKILAHYLQEKNPDAKFCVLRQDDDFGKDLTTGITQVLGKVTAEQKYAVSNESLTAQIGALQQAGCTVNLLGTVTPFTALALGTAAKMGYRAQWAASSSGGDYPSLVGYLGEDVGPKLLEGLVAANYLPFNADDDWVKLFQQINTEYNADAPFTGNTIYGMSMAYTFAEALSQAGENPTREGIIEALQSGSVKSNGITPAAFSATNHEPFGGAGITVVSKGVQAYLDGQVFTTDAQAGPVEAYTGPAVALTGEGIPGK
ncbi:ABC transporter substrate-binding protein [Kineosporia sp. NBRC 101731]|nr:ABC transporter substrate-binding protein [Kineosporia sp. NBRC 101731]